MLKNASFLDIVAVHTAENETSKVDDAIELRNSARRAPRGQQHDGPAALEESEGWGPLHHLEVLSVPRTFALLRAGGDVHVRASALVSPIERAKELCRSGAAAVDSAAYVVLQAGCPWSPQIHKHYPPQMRARAFKLRLVGEWLSRQERFAAYGPQAVIHAWEGFVMPRALTVGEEEGVAGLSMLVRALRI